MYITRLLIVPARTSRREFPRGPYGGISSWRTYVYGKKSAFKAGTYDNFSWISIRKRQMR
jgi:hypothetical protein